MSPITHLLAGWSVANTAELGRTDRSLVTLSGLIPDIDSFGLLMRLIPISTIDQAQWWPDYHHRLGHNITFGLGLAIICLAFGKDKVKTALLALISFHTHIIFDLIGSKGPDGYQWPIWYLYPFAEMQLTWSYQWELNSWPNFAITALLLAYTFHIARSKGRTPIEFISIRADRAVVDTLRRRP